MSNKNFLAQFDMDESAEAAEANEVTDQVEEHNAAPKGGFVNNFNLLDDSESAGDEVDESSMGPQMNLKKLKSEKQVDDEVGKEGSLPERSQGSQMMRGITLGQVAAPSGTGREGVNQVLLDDNNTAVTPDKVSGLNMDEELLEEQAMNVDAERVELDFNLGPRKKQSDRRRTEYQRERRLAEQPANGDDFIPRSMNVPDMQKLKSMQPQSVHQPSRAGVGHDLGQKSSQWDDQQFPGSITETFNQSELSPLKINENPNTSPKKQESITKTHKASPNRNNTSFQASVKQQQSILEKLLNTNSVNQSILNHKLFMPLNQGTSPHLRENRNKKG